MPSERDSTALDVDGCRGGRFYIPFSPGGAVEVLAAAGPRTEIGARERARLALGV